MNSGSLTTHNNYALLDYYSNLITIKRFHSDDKENLERLLKESYAGIQNAADRDTLATFYHEITHFLDLTATAWGLEFVNRKNLLLSHDPRGREFQNSLEVFMLNVSEIRIHADLTINVSGATLLNCVTHKSLIYDEKHGSFIMVYFVREEEVICEVPVSMLSLLEANAFASEILCKIKAIENESENEIVKIISLNSLNDAVEKYLNNGEMVEYSLFIILCKIHFKKLSLKEMLIFLQVIIRFTLNLSALNLSIFSHHLKSRFINERVGNAICKDLQRGLSRQVIAFELILLIYEVIQNSQEKESLILELKNNPKLIIDKVFDFFGIEEIYRDIDYSQYGDFGLFLKMILEKNDSFDHLIFKESSQHNFDILKEQNVPEINFDELLLLDMVLDDRTTVITAPNRIKLDVREYSGKIKGQIELLEKVYKENKGRKFHIHPDDISSSEV